MKAALVVVLVLLAGGVAHAYPQYQLSRDQTCSGCHLSPSGGGLLSENGLATAETVSQLGQAPEFFYGKVPTPDWLALGGDIRGATGYIQTPERVLAAFPMQLELYARATFGNFAVHITGGTRPPQDEGSYPVPLWTREHYIQWQQNAGEATGLFIRAGRFMPVFGLRFAEHPMYTRRNGGTALYSDTYGVNVSYIDPKFEAHASGFIKDPLIDQVEARNGGALYAEVRASETLQIGAGGMYEQTDFDKKVRVTATGKLYLPGPDVLLQLEAQFMNQLVDETATNPAGGAPKQLIGNFVATKMLNDFLMLDVGIGHFDSNIRIKDLDRDAIDVNLHYFLTSHVELLLNARLELMAFGNGGDPGAYALGQLHYRL